MSNDVRKRRVLQALVYGGVGTVVGEYIWSFILFILGTGDSEPNHIVKVYLPGVICAYIALAIHARDEDP